MRLQLAADVETMMSWGMASLKVWLAGKAAILYRNAADNPALPRRARPCNTSQNTHISNPTCHRGHANE